MRHIAYCARCGQRIQRIGLRWRHQRPQPNGAPHDHKAEVEELQEEPYRELTDAEQEAEDRTWD
jgi:hypothetical protein